MTSKHSVGVLDLNSSMWRGIYASGKGNLRYPNDVLVRLGGRLFIEQKARILDFGFGSGANLLHFAEQGFDMYGVEISEHACAITREKLQRTGCSAHLQLVGAGARLPFDNNWFSICYSWQVLYYNDPERWKNIVQELERVVVPGGLIVIATAAPGDVSHENAEALGGHVYKSRVSEQQGCVVTIPDREALPSFFPEQQLEIGEFGFSFGHLVTRHWIVSYKVRKHE